MSMTNRRRTDGHRTEILVSNIGLPGVTSVAASILGLGERLGRLEEGRQGDMVILDRSGATSILGNLGGVSMNPLP